MRLYNHFETGTQGSRVTAFGSSNPYPWDFVDGSTTTTIYDNTHARGLMAGKFLTGASAAKAMATWTPSDDDDGSQYGVQTEVYGRLYIEWLAAYPASITPITAVVDAGNSIACRVLLLTDGTLRITSAAGVTLATSVASIPTGAPVRIEWHLTHDASAGAFACRAYYTDPEAAVADFDFEITATSANTGASSQGAQFGWCASIANAPSMWLDAIEVNTSGWIGPSLEEPAKTFIAWRNDVSPLPYVIDQSGASQNAVNDFITRLYEEEGRMQFVSVPRRRNTASMRFEVRQDDVAHNGLSERTTLNAVGTTYGDGDDFWFAISVLLDPSFPDPMSGFWLILYQLFGTSGGESTGSPPFALELSDDGRFTMTVRGGAKATAGDPAPRESFQSFGVATLNVWHDFLFHVSLSTTSSGAVDGYYRLAGDAWPGSPTVSDTGINMLTVNSVLQLEWNSMNLYRRTRPEPAVGYFGLAAIQPDRALLEPMFDDDPVVIPVPPAGNPGGGGFGAVMSDAHFKRYRPGDLGPGYRPAYESHLRKQKSGR